MSPALIRERAAVLTVVVMGLGSGFHGLAGGRLPGLGWLISLGLLTYLSSRRLLRAPASRRRIVAAAVIGQAAIHAALTALAGHGHDAPAFTAGAPAGAPAPGTLAAELASVPPTGSASYDPVALGLQRITEDLTVEHLPMALAHALAAALVGVWLARGERALIGLVALWLARRIPALPSLPTPDHPVAAPHPSEPRLDSYRLLSSAGRRGPPVVVAS